MKSRLAGGLLAGCLGALGWVALRPGQVELARYATPMEGRTGSQRHNARLAAHRLDGAVVAPGEVFSFNDRVGTFSRDQGYRKAPVSYNGQLIDSWGGGVCQVSTTVYNAALLAGLEVVERNRHRFAPSYVAPGRDAAVAFNSIDLKVRNPHPFPVRIAARLDDARLWVAVWGDRPLSETPRVVTRVRQMRPAPVVEIGSGGGGRRVRNTGKDGWEVEVYRVAGGRRELVSVDSYPAMARIVQGP